MNVLQRAAELANDDWTEEEAGCELAASAIRPAAHRATGLLAGLATNPYVDTRGIRMSRIIWKALEV